MWKWHRYLPAKFWKALNSTTCLDLGLNQKYIKKIGYYCYTILIGQFWKMKISITMKLFERSVSINSWFYFHWNIMKDSFSKHQFHLKFVLNIFKLFLKLSTLNFPSVCLWNNLMFSKYECWSMKYANIETKY